MKPFKSNIREHIIHGEEIPREELCPNRTYAVLWYLKDKEVTPDKHKTQWGIVQLDVNLQAIHAYNLKHCKGAWSDERHPLASYTHVFEASPFQVKAMADHLDAIYYRQKYDAMRTMHSEHRNWVRKLLAHPLHRIASCMIKTLHL